MDNPSGEPRDDETLPETETETESGKVENSVAISSPRKIVLGIIDATNIKCTNLNRKRRWDQAPVSIDTLPTEKKPCIDHTNSVHQNEQHIDNIADGEKEETVSVISDPFEEGAGNELTGHASFLSSSQDPSCVETKTPESIELPHDSSTKSSIDGRMKFHDDAQNDEIINKDRAKIVEIIDSDTSSETSSDQINVGTCKKDLNRSSTSLLESNGHSQSAGRSTDKSGQSSEVVAPSIEKEEMKSEPYIELADKFCKEGETVDVSSSPVGSVPSTRPKSIEHPQVPLDVNSENAVTVSLNGSKDVYFGESSSENIRTTSVSQDECLQPLTSTSDSNLNVSKYKIARKESRTTTNLSSNVECDKNLSIVGKSESLIAHQETQVLDISSSSSDKNKLEESNLVGSFNPLQDDSGKSSNKTALSKDKEDSKPIAEEESSSSDSKGNNSELLSSESNISIQEAVIVVASDNELMRCNEESSKVVEIGSDPDDLDEAEIIDSELEKESVDMSGQNSINMSSADNIDPAVMEIIFGIPPSKPLTVAKTEEAYPALQSPKPNVEMNEVVGSKRTVDRVGVGKPKEIREEVKKKNIKGVTSKIVENKKRKFENSNKVGEGNLHSDISEEVKRVKTTHNIGSAEQSVSIGIERKSGSCNISLVGNMYDSDDSEEMDDSNEPLVESGEGGDISSTKMEGKKLIQVIGSAGSGVSAVCLGEKEEISEVDNTDKKCEIGCTNIVIESDSAVGGTIDEKKELKNNSDTSINKLATAAIGRVGIVQEENDETAESETDRFHGEKVDSQGRAVGLTSQEKKVMKKRNDDFVEQNENKEEKNPTVSSDLRNKNQLLKNDLESKKSRSISNIMEIPKSIEETDVQHTKIKTREKEEPKELSIGAVITEKKVKEAIILEEDNNINDEVEICKEVVETRETKDTINKEDLPGRKGDAGVTDTLMVAESVDKNICETDIVENRDVNQTTVETGEGVKEETKTEKANTTESGTELVVMPDTELKEGKVSTVVHVVEAEGVKVQNEGATLKESVITKNEEDKILDAGEPLLGIEILNKVTETNFEDEEVIQEGKQDIVDVIVESEILDKDVNVDTIEEKQVMQVEIEVEKKTNDEPSQVEKKIIENIPEMEIDEEIVDPKTCGSEILPKYDLNTIEESESKTLDKDIILQDSGIAESENGKKGKLMGHIDKLVDVVNRSNIKIEDVESTEISESVEEKDTSKPVEETEIAELVEGAEISESVKEREVAEPVEGAEISESVKEREVAEPVEGAELSEPVGEREVAELVEGAEISEPVEETEILESVEETEISEPMEEAEILESMAETEISEPVAETEILQAVKNSEISGTVENPVVSQVVESPEITQAVEDKTISKPVEETEITQPVEDKKISKPVEETEISPTEEEIEISELVEGTEISQDETETEMSQVVEDTEISQVVEDPEISQVVEDTEISQVVENTEISQVVEDTEISQVVEDTEISQVVEDTEISQVVEDTEISQVVEDTEISQVVEETEISQVEVETEMSEVMVNAEISPAEEEIEISELVEGTEISQIMEDTEISLVMEDTEISQSMDDTEIPPVMEDTEVSQVLEDTEILQVAEDTEVSQVLEDTEVSQVVEDTEIPQALEDTEISEIVEGTEIPQALEDTEISEIVEGTEIPQALEDTEISEIVEGTEIPQALEDTEISEIVEGTEIPQALEDTEISEIVEGTEIPQALEDTEISEIVEGTEIPQALEDTEISEIVEGTEIPQALEDTEISEVQENTEILQVMDDSEISQDVEEVEIEGEESKEKTVSVPEVNQSTDKDINKYDIEEKSGVTVKWETLQEENVKLENSSNKGELDIKEMVIEESVSVGIKKIEGDVIQENKINQTDEKLKNDTLGEQSEIKPSKKEVIEKVKSDIENSSVSSGQIKSIDDKCFKVETDEAIVEMETEDVTINCQTEEDIHVESHEFMLDNTEIVTVDPNKPLMSEDSIDMISETKPFPTAMEQVNYIATDTEVTKQMPKNSENENSKKNKTDELQNKKCFIDVQKKESMDDNKLETTAHTQSKQSLNVGEVSLIEHSVEAVKGTGDEGKIIRPLKVILTSNSEKDSKISVNEVRAENEDKKVSSIKYNEIKIEGEPNLSVKPIDTVSEEKRNIPLLTTVNQQLGQGSDSSRSKVVETSVKSVDTFSVRKSQVIETAVPKLEPITLRIFKDNLNIRTEGPDSPKRNRSPKSTPELKSQLSPHVKIADSKSSLSPQSKQLEFTLKIAKDATTNIPKATMSPKSGLSPSNNSTWKSPDFSRVEKILKDSNVSITPVSPTSSNPDPKMNKITLKLSKDGGHPEIKPQGEVIRLSSSDSSSSPEIVMEKIISPPEKRVKSDNEQTQILVKEETLKVEPEYKLTEDVPSKEKKIEEMSTPKNILVNNKEPPTTSHKKRGRPRKVIVANAEPSGVSANSEASDGSQSMFPVPQFDLTDDITDGDQDGNGSDDPNTPNRPMRSCRGRTKPIVVRTRKPRGGGIVRGGIVRGGTRARGGKSQLATDMENLSAYELAELAKIEARREKLKQDRIAKRDAKKAKVLAKKLKDEERRKRIAREKAEAQALQMFEEETRMSAPDNSRAHTPGPGRVNLSGEYGEESQGSISNTLTNNHNKKGRMEIPLDLECKEVRVDQLAEYQWQGSELFMIQEQISLYLGVKSFKRKYPDLKRRQVEAEERTFLEESGLVPKSMCDLGLTAVSSAEVLDIMFHDFPDKYEEFRKHVREKQAKEAIYKQKAALASSLKQGEKLKIEPREQAIESAAAWNANLNRERKEDRRCAVDLQTFNVHYPRSRHQSMTKPAPKLGNYPVSLLPGQFCDYYKKFTSPELMYFPVNTVLYGPMRPNEMHLIGSEASQTDDSDSSSSDDSSGSSSESEGSNHHDESRKCRACNGTKKHNKQGNPEVLIQCGQCKNAVHPTCQDLTVEMVPHIKKYNWQCTDCKTCIQCKDPANEDKMLFCDLCDRGYHIYCVGLHKVPEGRWHCTECSVCSSCGTKEPGGSEWQHEFKKGDKGVKMYFRTFCVPCSKLWKKGKYCQICLKCHSLKPEEEPDLQQCNTCDRWIHKECLSGRVGVANKIINNGFQCDLCQERVQSAINNSAASRPVIKV